MVQKAPFERREFYLLEDKLKLFVKESDGSIEEFVAYEDVTTTTRRFTSQNAKLAMAAFSFATFALIGFALDVLGYPFLMRWARAWVVFAAILFAFHVAKRRNYLLVDLANGKSLFFLAAKPSAEALDQFLAALQDTRKSYLRRRYFHVDPNNSPQAELARLKWFVDNNVVTAEEFEVVKERLTSVPRAQDDDEDSEGEPPAVH